MEVSTELKIKCLFCSSDQFVINTKPVPGDQIQCANCGKDNDYDSMFRVLKKYGQQWFEQQVKSLVEDSAKELRKKLNKNHLTLT